MIKKTNNTKKELIVSFARRRGKNDFKKLLYCLNLKSDFLFLNDPSESWYLNGAGKYANSFRELRKRLSLKYSGYSRVTHIGLSMGGYAGILYGSILKVDKVIAYAPQTDLSFAISDRDFYKQNPYLMKKYGNLRNFINDSTQYYIWTLWNHSRSHGLYHFNHIKDFKNANSFKLPTRLPKELLDGKNLDSYPEHINIIKQLLNK